jgi:predicted ABC-type ATPase
MEGGHDVPIPKIISRYSKSIANCCFVAKMVDRAYIYDNSIENADALLLFRIINGEMTKEYITPFLWAKPIFDFISEQS